MTATDLRKLTNALDGAAVFLTNLYDGDTIPEGQVAAALTWALLGEHLPADDDIVTVLTPLVSMLVVAR